MEIFTLVGLNFAAWIVGLTIGSFAIGNLVLISSYGMPMVVRLKNKGFISSSAPVRRYVIGFLVHLVVVAISVFAVMQFLPNFHLAFLIGLAIAVVRLSPDKSRFNTDNLNDFIDGNSQHFDREVNDLSETEFQELFDLRQIKGIEGNQLFARVFGELISNSLFYAVLVFGIILISQLSWWIGVILGGIFAAIVALSFLQTGFATITTITGWPALFLTRNDEGGIVFRQQLWMSASAVLRVIELMIDLIFLWILYANFFGNMHTG